MKKLDREYFDEVSQPLTDLFLETESKLINETVKQAKKNPTTERGVKAKRLFAVSTLAILSKATKKADKVIDKVVKNIVSDSLISTGFKDFNIADFVTEINEAKTILKGMTTKATSTMFISAQGGFNSLTSLIAQEQARAKEIELATESVVAGKASFDTAVRNAVKNLADEGISAYTDKLGRRYSPESYISMNVRTQAQQTVRETIFSQMGRESQDVFQVSAHAGARPLCEPYQGKFYSKSGNEGYITDLNGNKHFYESIFKTSYGDAGGLFGINCGHYPIPVVEGYFVDNISQDLLSKEENERIYLESQQQRRIETSVRNTQREADTLNQYKKGWGDEASSKATALREKYRDFCEETGRTPRWDRTQILT